TDAHAKNYSLLLSGPQVRLAPLYDIASILPYDTVDKRKVKLAMKIGGEYKLDQIGSRQWQKFVRETRLDADAFLGRLHAMARQLPDEVTAARELARGQGLDAPVLERLAAQLVARSRECQRLLDA